MNKKTAKRLIGLGFDEKEVNRICKYFHPKRKGKYKMEIFDIEDLDQKVETGIWVEQTYFNNDTELSIIHYFFEGLAYVMTVSETGKEIGRGIIDGSAFEEVEDHERQPWHWISRSDIKELVKDMTGLMFENNKPGDIINIAVWDGFEGDVKILEQHKDKCLIEIQDVCMCYPSQVQMQKGERLWIRPRDLFTYDSERAKRNLRRRAKWESSFTKQ